MILNAKGVEFPAGKSFVRVIVEIQMCQLDVLLGQGIHIDAETVVLAGDFDLAGAEVLDRVVGATVAELELISLGAHRQGEDLVA